MRHRIAFWGSGIQSKMTCIHQLLGIWKFPGQVECIAGNGTPPGKTPISLCERRFFAGGISLEEILILNQVDG